LAELAARIHGPLTDHKTPKLSHTPKGE
jgi:hypothetical protein